ncbi:hypothetical protein ACH347_32985 [Saccharopolyspora sp. 5N102]|uniref:hypothetical protein n=1 Tax=Saccharopolyspora sp. 5N102 TaxID=3375155 RepID=UPI0037B74A22
MLEEVPGAFAFLSVCPPDRDVEKAPYNHMVLLLLAVLAVLAVHGMREGRGTGLKTS